MKNNVAIFFNIYKNAKPKRNRKTRKRRIRKIKMRNSNRRNKKAKIINRKIGTSTKNKNCK